MIVDESTATRVRAGSPDPPEAVIREARRRQRVRWIAGITGAAVVLLVAAVVALGSLGGGGRPTRSGPAGPGQPSGPTVLPPPPAQVVVWAQMANGWMSIQVDSTRSGRVVRTLATDVTLPDNTPQPSVSPSGTVYYDTTVGDSAPPNPGPLVRELVMRVPLAGGTPAVVADGHDPQVSPDGRLLAYLTWTQISNQPESVVVTDLGTGATEVWRFATVVPVISRISWSPDSSSLMVATEHWDGRSSRLHALRLVLADPNRSLDALSPVPLPRCPAPTPWAAASANRDMAWAGFLTPTEGIGECHHYGVVPHDDSTTPVLFDLASGRVITDLPSVPGIVQQGTGGGFQVDPSGHYLLFVGNGHGAGGIYRWTVTSHPVGATARPVLIANSVASAAWVPPPAAPGPH